MSLFSSCSGKEKGTIIIIIIIVMVFAILLNGQHVKLTLGFYLSTEDMRHCANPSTGLESLQLECVKCCCLIHSTG